MLTTEAAAPVAGGVPEKTAEEELSLPIALADRLKKAASDTDSFKPECSELAARADQLAGALRSVVRRLSSLPSAAAPYTPPLRRIAAAAATALDRALVLARRCRRHLHSGSPSAVLDRLILAFTGTGAADFRRALNSLEASLADLRWLLSLYSSSFPEGPGGGAAGINLSLPPIATTDPMISYVWSHVAAVQMSSSPSERAEAAQYIANLALDNDRNKWVIVDEGGLPPLLALLKEADGEASQTAAAAALMNLAADGELVAHIVGALAVPAIVQIVSNASFMRLQTQLASLIARMAAVCSVAQEEFARENAVRPLVSLLSLGVPLGVVSVQSLVRLNREVGASSPSSQGSNLYFANGGSGKDRCKEWENESSEAKLALKVACAEALWMLSRGSISNSQKIAETKGLLVLMKLIETEKDELQHNCLMTVMEVAAAAESDADLRSSAFKKNSAAAKSVTEQLLRVVQEEQSPTLRIAAIRSIGSLARTFPAREARVLLPLVLQLWDQNLDVNYEAAIALGKFVVPENFLCVEHSKSILEFDGVQPLMRLLLAGERSQFPALALLCYLALHVPRSEALERSNVLTALESVGHTSVAHHIYLKELISKAIYQLQLYRDESHSHVNTDTIT